MIDQTYTQGEQQVKVGKPAGYRKPKSKKPSVCIGIVVLVGVIGSVFSTIGYRALDARYLNDQSLAQTGIAHLRKAEALLAAYPHNFFDDRPVNQARQEFTDA